MGTPSSHKLSKGETITLIQHSDDGHLICECSNILRIIFFLNEFPLTKSTLLQLCKKFCGTATSSPSNMLQCLDLLITRGVVTVSHKGEYRSEYRDELRTHFSTDTEVNRMFEILQETSKRICDCDEAEIVYMAAIWLTAVRLIWNKEDVAKLEPVGIRIHSTFDSKCMFQENLKFCQDTTSIIEQDKFKFSPPFLHRIKELEGISNWRLNNAEETIQKLGAYAGEATVGKEQYLDYRHQVANAHNTKENFIEARRIYIETLEGRKSLLGKDDTAMEKKIKDTEANIASCDIELGNANPALTSLRTIYKWRKVNNDTIKAIQTLHKIGYCYYKLRQWYSARDNFQKCWEKGTAQNYSRLDKISITRYMLGKVLMILGDTSTACQHLEWAYNSQKSILTLGHPDTENTLQALRLAREREAERSGKTWEELPEPKDGDITGADLRPPFSYLEANFDVPAATLLGLGGQGRVFKMMCLADGKYYAVKAIQTLCDTEEQEAKILQRIPAHDNIVLYQHSWTEAGPKSYGNPVIPEVQEACLFIQMEFCVKGTLREYMKDTGPPNTATLIEYKKRGHKIFVQIMDALRHIHSVVNIHGTHQRPILHRDVKPENIFLNGEIVKLGDFGIAKEFTEGQMTAQLNSTIYTAPEMKQRGNKDYKASVDVYSAGKIYYELLSGIGAFYESESEKWENAMTEIEKLKFGDVFLKRFPNEVAVIKEMLDPNPDKRPTAAEVIRLIEPTDDDELNVIVSPSLPSNMDVKKLAAFLTLEDIRIADYWDDFCEALNQKKPPIGDGTVDKEMIEKVLNDWFLYKGNKGSIKLLVEELVRKRLLDLVGNIGRIRIYVS